jgi:hypothetical protein
MSMGSRQKYAFPMILIAVLSWILTPRLLAAEEPLINKVLYLTFLGALIFLLIYMVASLESLDQKIWRKKIQG